MAYILVIDDNAVIRDVIKFTLQYRHSVTTATNGKEGIELAEASHFDLIITDIKMPEMNGIDFVKQIRKNESYATTPILMLTATLEENLEMLNESKAAGASGWMLKPFEPGKLLETIDELLK